MELTEKKQLVLIIIISNDGGGQDDLESIRIPGVGMTGNEGVGVPSDHSVDTRCRFNMGAASLTLAQY